MDTSQSTSQREDFENGEVEAEVEVRAVKVGEINAADCPPTPATAYPGRYGKNNKTGSIKTKQQFLEEAVRFWVEHFEGSDKYENTSLSNKARYLVWHLRALKVNVKKARALIVKVESDQRREVVGEREGLVEDGQGAYGGGGDEADHVEEDNLDDQEEGEDGGEMENFDMGCDEEEDWDHQLMVRGLIVSEEEKVGGAESSEKRAEREFVVREYLEKSDDELFEGGLEIPDCVQNSVRFKERKKRFITTYLEDKGYQDSQEILEALSQAPPVVEETLRQKINHLTKPQKAERLLLKTLSDTIKRLKETPGREAKIQVLIIMAAISHHR